MYVAASTSNPLGRRPWNSRLSGVVRSRGRLGTTLPNYATFQRSRDWRIYPGTPQQFYKAPELVSRSGIGRMGFRVYAEDGGGIGPAGYGPRPRYPDAAPPEGMHYQWTGITWALVPDANGSGVVTPNIPTPPTTPTVAVAPTGLPLQSPSASGSGQVVLPDGTVITIAKPSGMNATLEQIKVWLEQDSIWSGVPNKWLVLGGVGAYFFFRRGGAR